MDKISQKQMKLNNELALAIENATNQDLNVSELKLNIKALIRIEKLGYVAINLNHLIKDQSEKYNEAKQSQKYFDNKIIEKSKEIEAYKKEN